MDSLQSINVRRLIGNIQAALTDGVADIFLEDTDNKITKRRVAIFMDSYVDHLVERGLLLGGERVTTSQPLGFRTVASRSRGRPSVVFDMDDGSTYRDRSKFYGLRTAKVYGKRNCKTLLLAGLTIKPVVPAERIVISCVINSDKKVVQ
jgi:hypothetical protein